MKAVCLAFSLLVAVATANPVEQRHAPRLLAYAPAPVDNPLKGLVPYQGDVRDMFPHSMEFNYLPYAALVKGYDTFDWQPLEAMLDDIASRGHQAVVRIFLEYPGKSGVIPGFLVRDGLRVTHWHYPGTDPLPPATIESPDYEDKNLRRSLASFLAAFGKKYDGDPRLGFLTAGLLGIWGEWHSYPRDGMFASKTVQIEVMAAYEAAFKTTPVLMRYPAGTNHETKASNAHRNFGYHDDSFAWATLHTGKKNDDWFYMTALMTAGAEAKARWKSCPIGGEIRPEAWGKVFDPIPGLKAIQDFRTCVETTHVSWLMDSGMFGKKASAERIARAGAEVRRMGYEFHITEVTIGRVMHGSLEVNLKLENRGVAPFYYDWKPEYQLLAKGKPVRTSPGSGKLTGLLPGDNPRVWTDIISVSGLPPGKYTLVVRVPNLLKSGKPMRFANIAQDIDAPGCLSLGEVDIP